MGAGFGGLWAARAMADEPVDVLLLDRNNYHTFFPLLYQVAAAELSPSEIAYPVRSILRRHRNVTFRMAEVTGLDLDAREVLTPTERIGYDHLILALGSVSHFFGVQGAAEHAYPLRQMREAIPLRHRILGCFERAAHERDPEARRRLLTFAIVGGGPTGVEYAGALAELVFGPLRRDYPGLDPDEIRIVLLEAGDRLLAGMSPELSVYARERLRRRRVQVRTGAVVERVGDRGLHLEGDEALEADTVVWTAGVQGDPVARAWGLPVARGGRVPVDPTLQVPGRPEVWVVGDLAWVEEGGEPLSQVAPVAIQEGEWAARNVLRSLRGSDPEPFRFHDPGLLAVIGRNAAVADLWGRKFTGFAAWVLWLAIHIAKLIGFRNRALVLVNWAWNYVFPKRSVRLILPAEGEP